MDTATPMALLGSRRRCLDAPSSQGWGVRRVESPFFGMQTPMCGGSSALIGNGCLGATICAPSRQPLDSFDRDRNEMRPGGATAPEAGELGWYVIGA